MNKLVSASEAGKVSANFDYHPDDQIASVTSGRIVYGADQTWKVTGRYE